GHPVSNRIQIEGTPQGLSGRKVPPLGTASVAARCYRTPKWETLEIRRLFEPLAQPDCKSAQPTRGSSRENRTEWNRAGRCAGERGSVRLLRMEGLALKSPLRASLDFSA